MMIMMTMTISGGCSECEGSIVHLMNEKPQLSTRSSRDWSIEGLIENLVGSGHYFPFLFFVYATCILRTKFASPSCAIVFLSLFFF